MKISEADRSGVRLFPPLVFAVAMGMAFLIQRRFPLPVAGAEYAPTLRMVGVVFILDAIALAIWAIATFRRIGTTPNPAGGSTALALGGPYRISRNPMYLGLCVLQVGIGLAANVLWPLILLPLFVLLMRQAVIVPEERYLEAKFGEPYRAYKARVQRWI